MVDQDMEYYWSDTGRVKQKYTDKNQSSPVQLPLFPSHFTWTVLGRNPDLRIALCLNVRFLKRSFRCCISECYICYLLLLCSPCRMFIQLCHNCRQYS